MRSLRIAAFGFRSLPPKEGSAGADKFAEEFYPRLAARGHSVVAYNRNYLDEEFGTLYYKGVSVVTFKTVARKGFDTLLHSLKATYHIIRHDTGDIVHIHNGGNSIWALILRLAGKSVYVSQDGVDWLRAKWPWYGKAFLYASSYLTAHIPNEVIFDNIYSRDLFEKKFGKKFVFIPYGSEVAEGDAKADSEILQRLDLKGQQYFLFVGRFIPDKGLHYLISAFEKLQTNLKLVLVGGSPNPSDYEKTLRESKDPRIMFPGFIYGEDTNSLIRNAYAYIQPSDVEGLSPVVLTVMGLGTPLICSDIPENLYAVGDTALTFRKGDAASLREAMEKALREEAKLIELAAASKARAAKLFNWDAVTDEHVGLFLRDHA